MRWGLTIIVGLWVLAFAVTLLLLVTVLVEAFR